MKIPQMPVLQDQSKVYSPTSGVNLSKLPNEIDDGQNALMLNMWYRDTMLRTRPGLVKEIEQTYGKIVATYPANSNEPALLIKIQKNGVVTLEQYGIYIITVTSVLVYLTDGTIFKIPRSGQLSGTTWTYNYFDYDFSNISIVDGLKTHYNETEDTTNNIYIVDGIHFWILGGKDITPAAFVMDVGAFVYATSNDGVHSNANINPYYYIRKVVALHDIVNNVPMAPFNQNAYYPVIYTAMKASGSGTPSEARNYLCPEVKCEYFTDATNTVYHLPDQNIDNTYILVHYVNNVGAEYSFTISTGTTSAIVNGLTATLDRVAGTVTFSSHLDDSSVAEAAVPNLWVLYCKTVYPEPNPIVKCGIASWFGGAYQGQVSGDSIFAAGNPDEPNTIYHSAVGDPTYWPDDGADYIGSPADPITAFGKNFGKLFIFKENSVYEKSFYWDSVSLKQSYPTSEVHIGIGCDMPNSVQLINNSLTWANSKGGVYTVATTNTNNERVIVPISQNINPDLLKNSLADLQVAVSVDDGFYYYLFVGTKVYLWDYNSTAFIDYSDILKAQNRLAWYIWTIPCALTTAFLFGGKVWGASAADNFLYAFDPIQSLDEGNTWFDAYLISKAFDNGLPQFKKQPYYYIFNMACAGVVGIEIQLIDEVDTCSILETLEGGDSEAMASIPLRQAMSWGKTYQVAVHRLNGDTGAFAISSYSIKSKIGKEV